MGCIEEGGEDEADGEEQVLEKMSGQCDGVWQKEEGTMGKGQEEKWKVAGGNSQYEGVTYIPYLEHTAFASLEPGSV
ncbi:hypothetical protein BGAL_0216g00170 [Botrytis galanthina]|uniref:Uncharacterized protein n=1 Tax=Botrytis galanthina TaxID=278940 RepID=A0A4S8QUP3_9HELO|nr:hypothetical protein BGAL_0216g00170 [Botrytis galanthina]